MSEILDRILCVRCAAALDSRREDIACSRCGERYARVGRIPVLLPAPRAHVELWRRQLALLLSNGAETYAALEAAAAADDVLPDGATRLRAMANAVRDQANDFAALLSPALGGPLEGGANGLPRGVVEYSYYLFRDWGWIGSEMGENEQALAALREIAQGDLGRLLVLGAGAARLAYDMHRRCGATETVVVDIDPYLFVIAEAVVRGRPVRLTEASLNVLEASHVSTAWTLSAPDGPLDDERFHFLLANGLQPPFADATFDTIVTPWFIDRVPTDLGAFLQTLRRLLRPGGRWLNQGPLLYSPETPLARRYSRDEIFDLAARAGFKIERWDSASRPYLVSPLTGSGKTERVLTFEAVRTPD
ncbi:MAG TPA: class I SAM-dependent methyltransferase [Polyangiaceae bacterium]